MVYKQLKALWDIKHPLPFNKNEFINYGRDWQTNDCSLQK